MLQSDRFELRAPALSMKAVVTAGAGGYERLEYRDVPRPTPTHGEVLVQVEAAGVNNTDVNARIGWYASSVNTGTAQTSPTADSNTFGRGEGGWRGAVPFPLIQGTDCCGTVVAVGASADAGLLGVRVLIRPCMQIPGYDPDEELWLGSDLDGAFAQFVCVPSSEAFPVRSAWSAAELASIPCAYGTAENMLLRAGITAGQRVLVTGASGGVGSAAVQLARLRSATVTAMVAPAKSAALRELGAEHTIGRDADLVAGLGEKSFDAVIDTVAGPTFPDMLRVLRRRGRYVSAGAIAGPAVSLDMRTLYLKDLTLLGCTSWGLDVFPNLITYIEGGRIRPLVAKTFALAEIAAAQREFGQKNHVGKLVLIPPVPLSKADP
jgi:NADPH:quinone reductase-like Zn-dependent oxidoreductase